MTMSWLNLAHPLHALRMHFSLVWLPCFTLGNAENKRQVLQPFLGGSCVLSEKHGEFVSRQITITIGIKIFKELSCRLCKDKRSELVHDE